MLDHQRIPQTHLSKILMQIQLKPLPTPFLMWMQNHHIRITLLNTWRNPSCCLTSLLPSPVPTVFTYLLIFKLHGIAESLPTPIILLVTVGRRVHSYTLDLHYHVVSVATKKGGNLIQLIMVDDNNYIESIRVSTMWWDGFFIGSFAQMASYYAHTTFHQRQSTLERPILPHVMHITYPKEPISKDMLVSSPNEVSQVISVVHNSQHYAVLLIDITDKCVVIFDGLYRPLLDWIDHVISSLKHTRLVAIDDNFVFLFIMIPTYLFKSPFLRKCGAGKVSTKQKKWDGMEGQTAFYVRRKHLHCGMSKTTLFFLTRRPQVMDEIIPRSP
jgi:hypothetical protein